MLRNEASATDGIATFNLPLKFLVTKPVSHQAKLPQLELFF
ncbi:hypothetical protein [Pedobacter aquatilis]|nr:hypothetical protein [Pedobacter aquatilis]